MNIRRLPIAKLMILLLGIGLLWQSLFGSDSALKPVEGVQAAGLGDIKTLQAKYDGWKRMQQQDGMEGKLTLPLSYTKGLSAKWTKAFGKGINRNFGGARVPSFIFLAVNLRKAVEEKWHLSDTSL